MQFQDPWSGIRDGKIRIRDAGWKKVDPGLTSRNRNTEFFWYQLLDSNEPLRAYEISFH